MSQLGPKCEILIASNRQDLASNIEMLTDQVDGLTREESEGKVPRWRGEAC